MSNESLKRFALGIGALLGLFVLIAIGGALIRRASPEPVAVATIAGSPLPTFAIAPSWTVPPAEPTATPAPTNTPEPTATSEPTATINPDAEAEAAYRHLATETMKAYSEGFALFSEQNKAAGENPRLILNDEWILRTVLATALIEETSRRILEFENIPPRYQAFHSEFAQVAKLNEQSMQLYRQSVDARDAAGLQESVRLVEQANEILSRLDVDSLQP